MKSALQVLAIFAVIGLRIVQVFDEPKTCTCDTVTANGLIVGCVGYSEQSIRQQWVPK